MSPPCSKVSKGIKALNSAVFTTFHDLILTYLPAPASYEAMFQLSQTSKTHFWFPTCAFVYPICSVWNILSPNSVNILAVV